MIDENGESLGVMPAEKALRAAKDRDYDLVEVGPNASPPVCKILDFGKLKYELEKKNQKSKSKKSGETKEIRLGVNTEDHDFNTQVEKAKKFLEKGYKIRITVKMSGRQNIYSNRANAMIERFRKTLDLKYDVRPSRMGTRISAILLKGK